MNVNRLLMIKEDDVVGRFRDFLSAWWEETDITAMLAPVEQSGDGIVMTQVIHDKSDVGKINPFIPFMPTNSAAAIGDFINSNPTGRLVVVLRPCELRTLFELEKRHRLPLETGAQIDNRVVIIGVDCAGTFPPEEFEQRRATFGLDQVVQEAISYGLDGRPTPRQMRVSCQICNWPAPIGADLTIGSMGTAARGYMLLVARDENVDKDLSLAGAADCQANEHQISLREVAVGALADQHRHTMVEFQNEFNIKTGGVSDLLACLARCTLCADCLDACPLYNGELSSMLGVVGEDRRNRPLLSELVGLSRWLASCSGCGMCQEACENDVSLTLLITALSNRIRKELNYPAGDPRQLLPWDHQHGIAS
jgi:formate dehydrogenase subunit beta